MKRSMNKPMALTVLALLFSVSTLSGCGSSKDSKSAKIMAPGGGTPAEAQTAPPQLDAAPTNGNNTGLPGEIGNNTNINNNAEPSAPLGRVDQKNPTAGSSGSGSLPTQDTTSSSTLPVPKIDEATAVKTGGQTGDLVYTSASGDGLMDYFKQISVKVSASQQDMNKKLAQAIIGAKLVKSGDGYSLDLALNEFGKTTYYRLKGSVEASKIALSSISKTGDLDFQGGFVKCLSTDGSCAQAYAKIKMSGAYARVVFRTVDMNRHFQMQDGVTESGFQLWKKYILNSINAEGGSEQISRVQASSYEVLNGKSAMGIQLSTADKEVIGFNFPLVASSQSSDVQQEIKIGGDLSVNYNLPNLVSAKENLRTWIVSSQLVKNNGKGELKIQMKISRGNMWMVLFPVVSETMTASQVQAFESTVKFF